MKNWFLFLCLYIFFSCDFHENLIVSEKQHGLKFVLSFHNPNNFSCI